MFAEKSIAMITLLAIDKKIVKREEKNTQKTAKIQKRKKKELEK